MSKYVIVGFVLVAIGVATYIGCDGAKARVGVAQDKAIARIDELLGPLNVQQKKVEQAYEELEGHTAQLREKRIEAEVRLKAYTVKHDELTAKKEKLLGNLTKLKGYLNDAADSGSVEVSGNTVTTEQLKALADEAVKQVKLVKDQQTKNAMISNAWAKNLDLLKKNESTSQTQLAKLDGQLDMIRSKKSALDGMREAATIAGPTESISDKFNDLTEEVEELLINIDTEFKIEEAKLDERIAELSEDVTLNVEELLGGDKTDVSGTLSDIDKLLEEEGGN